MPARGSGKTTKRYMTCPKCSHDEWRRVGNSFVCSECDRRGARVRKREQRKDAAFRIWESAKTRAEEKMVLFMIAVEDVQAVWPKDNRCPVFGSVLVSGKGFSHDGSPTLDRINPEWGYEPGNIAVISLKANRAKGGLTADELDAIVQWMRLTGLK